jgi:S1-C subfamily serine protease
MQTQAQVLPALSQQLTKTIAAVGSNVAVIGSGGRTTASGLFWGEDLVVAAESTLEGDQGLHVGGALGEPVAATLIGRDPSTNIALIRLPSPHGAGAWVGTGAAPEPGQLAIAVGRRRQAVTARLGIVSLAAGPWQSLRGGDIDRLIELDIGLDRQGEGSAVLNAGGELVGMAIFGPRGKVLVMPQPTLARVAEALVRNGRIARGYLGAGLQPIRLDDPDGAAKRAAIIVSIDPHGPARQAGLRQGDILLAWNGEAVRGIRDLQVRLGPASIGKPVTVQLLRAGAPETVTVTIGERPMARAG